MNELSTERVLEFWFGNEPYGSAVLAHRMHSWFEGGPAFDRQVADRFGAAIEPCARGGYTASEGSARGALAAILVLDQFPRHVFRGSARAFAYDEIALGLCKRALGQGRAEELDPVQRQFLFLPLQHSECLEDQVECVARFSRLGVEIPEGHWLAPVLKRALDVARFHELVIRRYGRYPHRNALLGRPSTLGEQMYLDAGGPSFGQLPERQPLSAATSARPVFRMFGPELSARDTLCVDGRVEGMRCLSHWPGTVAPAELQHDLSTGMALKYARSAPAERQRLLGAFSVVTNDHYDTDGALAAFALIEPELSLEHEDLMLRAARTGDLRTFTGEDALALDLTVWALANAPSSPLAAELAQIHDYTGRAQRCYNWLLSELPALLGQPFAWRSLWQPRFERILADLRAVEQQSGVSVQTRPGADLAVVTSSFPLTRHGLIHAAGEHNRVLHVLELADGPHYRFMYRNESWFLGLRDRVPRRLSLEPARARLQAEETASHGRWWCTRLDRTSAQLGFGSPDDTADVFEDLRQDLEPASHLPPARVLDALTFALSAPADKLAPRAPHSQLEHP